MAAGNCLPELSISLVGILVGGQDISTGEAVWEHNKTDWQLGVEIEAWSFKMSRLDRKMVKIFQGAGYSPILSPEQVQQLNQLGHSRQQ